MPKTAKKWIRNASDEIAVREGCYFDQAAGMHVVEFFEKFLVHSKGQWEGQPFTLADWQREGVVLPIFGWKRADGRRRFQEAFIAIAKKNGKSTLCSGLTLYGLTGEGEPGAEVYGAGSDREQAGIVYRESEAMVKASRALSDRLMPIASRKRIVSPLTNSFYQVLSADAFRAEGLNASMVIFDELHAQPDRRLYDALKFSGRARKEPLIVEITTAGSNKHSICGEQWEYAEKVIEGQVPDTSFFGYLCAADPEDDWTKESTWRKANPGLGVTLSVDDFARDLLEAQHKPASENTFRRYRLNQWVTAESRWLSTEKWDACSGEVDEKALVGRPCFAGLDLASTTDVAAFVLYFPDSGEVIKRFWVPGDNAIERDRRDRVPYTTWARQNLLIMTEGNVIDYDRIRSEILALASIYPIQECAYDRWNASQLVNQLEAEGLMMVPFGQGYASMSPPTKELEKLVLSGKLRHGGDPVLRWMASNVQVETDAAGNVKPNKGKSREKIDGIVALIMAIGRASVHKVEGPSVYAERGVVGW